MKISRHERRAAKALLDRYLAAETRSINGAISRIETAHDEVGRLLDLFEQANGRPATTIKEFLEWIAVSCLKPEEARIKLLSIRTLNPGAGD